jgi:hypothetical protein
MAELKLSQGEERRESNKKEKKEAGRREKPYVKVKLWQ